MKDLWKSVQYIKIRNVTIFVKIENALIIFLELSWRW